MTGLHERQQLRLVSRDLHRVRCVVALHKDDLGQALDHRPTVTVR